MSGEWMICQHCSLKYRAREPVCPRCEKPALAGQELWGDNLGTPERPPRSKLAIATPVILLLVGGAGAFAWFAPPGFFRPSLTQKISKVCTSRQRTDCACVGEKTAGLMSPEQRASFDAEEPSVRELMLTAEQLCLKDRLVSRCVEANQGNDLQCACVAGAAADAFTVTELDALFGDAAPERYASIRTDCLAKIPAR